MRLESLGHVDSFGGDDNNSDVRIDDLEVGARTVLHVNPVTHRSGSGDQVLGLWTVSKSTFSSRRKR